MAQTDAARERPREGDVLVAAGATAPAPLKPDDLTLGAKQTFAWPMDPATSTVRNGSRLNKVLLLRLAPEGFDPETKEHAADGVVAYSAICVHTGCDVTNWHNSRINRGSYREPIRSEANSDSAKLGGLRRCPATAISSSGTTAASLKSGRDRGWCRSRPY
jgi:Rieske Fe-S protein